MLTDLLGSTEHCGVPAEYCSPHKFSSWEGTHGFPARLRQEVLIGWWRRLRLRRFGDRSWRYEHAEIERLVRKAVDGRSGWDRYFAEREIEPYRVTYERFNADRRPEFDA